MIEDILKQIKEKKQEVRTLENLLQQEGLNDYKFLVGKYYRLAGTTSILITSLGYMAENYIYVNCLKITGGKYDGGRLRINHTDDYEIQLQDIPRLTEISKDKFNDFLDEAINEARKMVSDTAV